MINHKVHHFLTMLTPYLVKRVIVDYLYLFPEHNYEETGQTIWLKIY